MALTEEERKKKLDQFREVTKKDQPEENEPDPWTEQDLRDAANRIAERIGIDERW